MQQHHRFGQWLRQRYGGHLLPERYTEDDIYVRSTDVDRTLASAYSNLAGLYPPTQSQVWNKNLRWYPIPVHTVPDALDYILGGAISACPVYVAALNEAAESNDIQALLQKHKKLISYIISSSGTVFNNTLDELLDILLIRDTLFIEELYHKKLPNWTYSIYPSAALDELSLMYYVLPAYTPQLAKFRMGYFFKEILDRSAAKANGTLSPDRSMWVYSAHDANISTVLKGLGIFDNKFVQYTASLLFELRLKSHVPYLEIFYRRTADSNTAEPLRIPGCGYSCPLAKLYQLYSDILPNEEFFSACQL